ncbi:hypothetical protein [Nocardia sp. NPDC020380]|uniref:hypothetical protein n=1 Tax=Nocardia sp. NPDC020380 TaxID=3364309 RepID=UPI0037BB5443
MSGHDDPAGSEFGWPVADFDAVRRLRVLAAVAPAAVLHETVFDTAPDRVWAVAADLEGELPRWLFPDIADARYLPSGPDATRRLLVRGHSGLRARFDVVLEPGWCLMQSRFLLGGMAAVAEPGGGTRFALLGGFRGALRPLAPAARHASERAKVRALDRLGDRIRDRS